MTNIGEYYFRNDVEWRNWLQEHHDKVSGINLIFYKVDHENDSMRWEEAVQVALCYGWIDSTVKSLGNGKLARTKIFLSAQFKKYLEQTQ